MTINLTPEQRHKAMLANKSSDTKIEILLRKSLWHQGIRYRKNYKILSCKPDIVITKYKIAIFCDGDFWHGKPSANHNFKTNKNYWTEKIKRNIERDLENTIELRDNGWTVLRFWESDIKKNLDMCVETIIHHITQQNIKSKL
jgi:DNA mismatch endonuclease (patch repair protein)